MATRRRNGRAIIRVLILDDGLVPREGIAKVVEDTKVMTVVGTAATPQEALAILRDQAVDLALVDLVLGSQRSGVEVGREMRRIQSDLKVVIYTKQRGMVLAAEILWERKTGQQPKLQGYVLTENILSSGQLKTIYDSILHTGYYVDPEVLEWHYRLSSFESLTPREEECALLVAEGCSNQETAERMVLSQKRVENLVGTLYHKFHIPGDPRNPARRVLLAEAIKMLYGLRRPARKLTVLLVDDNRDDLRHLRELIGQDDRFEVIGEATSGRQGIEQARRKRPDLALVDVRMDELDGFQTTERMTAGQPDIRVILISVTKSQAYAEEARRVGAVAYFPKSELTADAVYRLGVQGIGEEGSQARR
jgi:DNA-binding NarL/FixJ family response regulator